MILRRLIIQSHWTMYSPKSERIQSFSGPFFCGIWTECGELQSKPKYSALMEKKTDQKNIEYGEF